jgi:hypothetical protein
MTREQVWEKGCRGIRLNAELQKQFAAMARSRFHTFQLGIEHARQQVDEKVSLGLITGLAKELNERPGLKNVWLRLSISQTESGKQVCLQLEKLEQNTIH